MTGPSAPARTKQGPPSDAELIAAARSGDNLALDSLVSRHRAAAQRLAGRLAPDAADKLLAESVATVTAALRAGGGPAMAFRTYLLTTVRRRNHARAAAAGRIRPVDDLSTARMASVSGSSVTTAALPAAAAVHRRMSEVTRLALWHTEVDGEEVRTVAALVDMPATEVAELAFRGREAFRQGTLGAYLNAVSEPACRWAAERFGAHGREALSDADATRVDEHLSGCDGCRAAYPAVEAVQNDLQVLLAMLVLGPAAAPYLGRELVPAGRAQLAAARGAGGGAGRALVGAGGRPSAMLGIGMFLAAGGLITSLALAGNDAGSDRAASGPPVAVAEAESGDGSKLDEDGPASGRASAGVEQEPTRAVERDSEAAAGAAQQPVRTPPRSPARDTPARPANQKPAPDDTASTERPAVARPAAEPATEDSAAAERRVLADLGVVQLAVTPDGGLLGLPLDLLPPEG